MTSRHQEDQLDEALDETFPASDPIAFQHPGHPEPDERPPEERAAAAAAVVGDA